MNSPTETSNDRERILRTYGELGSKEATARTLGLPRQQVRDVVNEFHGAAPRSKSTTPTGPMFTAARPVSADVPIEELVRRKYEDYGRLAAHKQASFIHTIKMKTNDPIGLGWFGDPHIDNNGCNLKLLHDHADVVRETPGLFGINLGDNLDFWIGRLMRLYADQATTDHDGRRLLDDFLLRVGYENWMALIFGNHDIWDGKGHPLHAFQNATAAVVEKYNVRLRLEFPNGRECLVWIRHDFPGSSMYNDVFGLCKAATMGAKFHIFAAGHKHTSSHHEEFNDKTGIYWHAFRSAGYKMVDEYPEELGLRDMNVFQCPVTIIDPNATSAVGLVKFEADTTDGADRLTWLRKKQGC